MKLQWCTQAEDPSTSLHIQNHSFCSSLLQSPGKAFLMVIPVSPAANGETQRFNPPCGSTNHLCSFPGLSPDAGLERQPVAGRMRVVPAEDEGVHVLWRFRTVCESMAIIVHSVAGPGSCLIGYALADQENSWGSSTLVSRQKKRFPPWDFS